MIDTVIKLLPALVGITAGYVLRLRGVAEHRDADFVFRLVINVFLPALAFTALSRVSMGRDLVVFPLAAVVIITLGYLTGRLLASKGPSLAPQQAVAICGLRRRPRQSRTRWRFGDGQAVRHEPATLCDRRRSAGQRVRSARSRGDR